MKKFIFGLALALVLASASSASAYTYTRDLTIGASGADVVALQDMLVAGGYLVMPAGVSKGYFGALTQSAVAKWQAAVGITPAAGYFGPISRAKASAAVTTTTTTTDTESLSGGDGDFKSFKVLGTPSSEDVFEGSSEKVFGVEFIAKDSDLKVDRVELMASSTSGIVTKPWKVLDEVAVYNGSKKIADIDASDSDNWDETASGSKIYTIKLAGISSIVKEGNKAKLYVEVTAQDNLESTDLGNWNISLTDNGLRAINAEGYDVTEGNDTATKSFSLKATEAGDVSVTVDENDNEDQSVSVDDNSDTNDVFAYVAAVKSKTGTNNVDSVDVTLSSPTSESLTDMIGTVYLLIDGDEVGSESAASTVSFDDLDYDIEEGDKIDFEVRLDLNDTNDGVRYQNGDSVKVTGLTVNYIDQNDDDKTASTNVAGGVLTLSTTTLNVSPASVSAKVLGNDAKGEFKVAFKVTAPADEDVYLPVTFSSTYVDVINASTNATTTATTTLTFARTSGGSDYSASYYKVTSGNTATFTLTATVDNTNGGARSLKVGVTGVQYKVGSTGASTEVYTSGVDEDYRTDSVYLETADLQ